MTGSHGKRSSKKCACGRPYPEELTKPSFWTPAADAELLRLRMEGVTYYEIAKSLKTTFNPRVNADKARYRHMMLCERIAAAAPRQPVVKVARAAKAEPPQPVGKIGRPAKDVPPPPEKNRNSCAVETCTRQRANGYAQCMAHLPGLVV